MRNETTDQKYLRLVEMLTDDAADEIGTIGAHHSYESYKVRVDRILKQRNKNMSRVIKAYSNLIKKEEAKKHETVL